jgi:hypothetical protein
MIKRVIMSVYVIQWIINSPNLPKKKMKPKIDWITYSIKEQL